MGHLYQPVCWLLCTPAVGYRIGLQGTQQSHCCLFSAFDQLVVHLWCKRRAKIHATSFIWLGCDFSRWATASSAFITRSPISRDLRVLTCSLATSSAQIAKAPGWKRRTYSAKHITKINRFPLKPNNRRSCWPVADVVGEYIRHQAPVLIDRFYVVFRGPNRYEIIAHVVCDVV